MGLVTDVYWTCPGCGSRERAQLESIVGDGEDLELDAVPLGHDVRYNPPCARCGKYQLTTQVIAATLAKIGAK